MRLFRRWSGLGQSSPLRYFQQLNGGRLPSDEMSAKIVSDMVSSRKVFSIIGLSVAFGFLRHHERRTGRHERRHTRCTGHTAFSETSSGVVAVSPSAYASLGTTRSRETASPRPAGGVGASPVASKGGTTCAACPEQQRELSTAARASASCRWFDRSFLISNVPRESGFSNSVDGESLVHGSADRTCYGDDTKSSSLGPRLGRDDNER
jgi:hypothetical protein